MSDFATQPDIIGKKVIIRGRASGVHFGTLKQYAFNGESAAVELADSRRIWYWNGAASISQLAVTGPLKEDNKITLPVSSILVLDAIEIIPCTEQAAKVIEDIAPWQV